MGGAIDIRTDQRYAKNIPGQAGNHIRIAETCHQHMCKFEPRRVALFPQTPRRVRDCFDSPPANCLIDLVVDSCDANVCQGFQGRR